MQGVRLARLEGAVPPRILRFGSWSGRVMFELDEEREWLALPAERMRELGLRPGDLLSTAAMTGPHSMRLGPLVGILLSSPTLERLQDPLASYYRSMAASARDAGVFPFFFEIGGVDEQTWRVEGWLDRDGRWERERLPLPDVIYHRATYPDPERRRAAARMVRELASLHGVSLLNGVGAFSKSQVHQALLFFPGTASLAPQTLPCRDLPSIQAMLARFRSLFVKAEHGSHGADVIRVRRETGGWQVLGQIDGRQVSELFPDAEQVESFLLFLSQRASWVMQQGIELPELDGRVMDVRVILQKDQAGEWVVPLVLVRHARAGSVAANMSQGGEPYLPAAFLELYGSQVPALANLEQTAAEAGIKVALALESRFGLLGEIGVDLGIDVAGRPWVFEANAKPLHPKLGGPPVYLWHHPFRYADYLARRAWQAREGGIH